MLKVTLPLLILLSIILLLNNGCAPIYRPPMANVPLFERDAEVQFGGYLTTNIIEANFANSISNNQAIAAAMIITTPNDSSSYYYGEFGYGFFNSMDGYGRMSLFVGLGYGVATANYDDDPNFNYSISAEGEFVRPYIQGNMAFGSKIFDGGLAARVAYIHILRYAENVNNRGFEELDPPGAVYLEPILFMNLGYDVIKFGGQIGFSFTTRPNLMYNYSPFIFGMGIVVQLPSKKKFEDR